MSPRDLAHIALWTEHPLCHLFAIANGRWIGGRFEPARSWSIKQLIAFAATLPDDMRERLAGRKAAR
jgi:hypothetical protein